MQKVLIFLVATGLLASPAVAQDIKAGSRVTITSDWHDANGGPYSPGVVSCTAKSGLCLNDNRLSPATRQMVQGNSGLQVSYPEFGVIYLFQKNGKGRFFDMKGKPTGHFSWRQ